VPYAVYETPFGQGWIAFQGDVPTSTGLPTSAPPDDMHADTPPAPIARLVQRLSDYFTSGARLPAAADFVPRAATTDLTARIYRRVAAIAPGETMTYTDVAEAVGAPGAARAVGAAMARNPFAPIIPCHRVVGSDGSLRGYAGGLAMKRALLEMEAHRG
jgi:methylated-DNA-[protein]-cysteine S-methyltransferase